MNVAKGADYTDFFQTSNNLYAFQTKKADINISAFLFISKLTATENDTTFAQVIRCHFYSYFIAR